LITAGLAGFCECDLAAYRGISPRYPADFLGHAKNVFFPGSKSGRYPLYHRGWMSTMSILAGYVGKNGRLPKDLIDDKIKSFSCMTNDNPLNYDSRLFPTQFGHVITRCKPDYPIRFDSPSDSSGNVLAVLGFFSFTDQPNSLKTLFNRCVKESPKIIENLEGEFVSVFSESRTGKIHIINDRFASRPFYVLKTSDRFYFSSNLAFLFHLAASKSGIDIIGLLQMFSYGHTIGEQTIFSDVQRMMPASHLILDSGILHKKRYWSLEHVPIEKLDPAEYASAVYDCFKEGAEYRAKLVDKGVIALSGGLDSRLVAYCLPDKNRYSAFTFIDSAETDDTAEVTAAKNVSGLLGLEHHLEFIPVARTSAISKDLILLTGGLRSLTHIVKTMSYIDFIKNRGFKYMLGGGPGDVIAGSKIPKHPICISPDGIEAGVKIFTEHYAAAHDMPTYLERLFKKDTVRDFYPSAVNSFNNSFHEIKGPTAAHQITAWALLNRWPAFTFTTPLHDHPDMTESFCHLGYKFCELMLKLPAEWLYAKNFYSYMIYQKLVNLRAVINANTGKKLSGEIINYQWVPPSRFVFFKKVLKERLKKSGALAQLLKYVRKPDTASPKLQYTQSSPPGFLYPIFREDKKLFSDLEEILNSIPDIKYLLELEKCLKFLKTFESGDTITGSFNRDTDLLGKLSAICYGYKYLIYR
jgi:hypothetical protein